MTNLIETSFWMANLVQTFSFLFFFSTWFLSEEGTAKFEYWYSSFPLKITKQMVDYDLEANCFNTIWLNLRLNDPFLDSETVVNTKQEFIRILDLLYRKWVLQSQTNLKNLFVATLSIISVLSTTKLPV